MGLRKMGFVDCFCLMILVDCKPHYRQLVAKRKTQSQTVNQTTQSGSRRKTTTDDFPNMSNLTEHTITGQSHNAISQNSFIKQVRTCHSSSVQLIMQTQLGTKWYQVRQKQVKYVNLISRVSTLQPKTWENGRGRAWCSYISVTCIT